MKQSRLYRLLSLSRLGSQEKFSELESLLFEGAVLLHEAGQVGSGVDLTKCFLEVLGKEKAKNKEEKPSEEAMERVAK